MVQCGQEASERVGWRGGRAGIRAEKLCVRCGAARGVSVQWERAKQHQLSRASMMGGAQYEICRGRAGCWAVLRVRSAARGRVGRGSRCDAVCGLWRGSAGCREEGRWASCATGLRIFSYMYCSVDVTREPSGVPRHSDTSSSNAAIWLLTAKMARGLEC